MKTYIIAFSLLLTNLTFSQTKLINHKSHSGKNSNFHKSLSSVFFDKGESNFGMAPQRYVRNSKLDSVILLSEKVAVMVTSESCHYEDYDGRGQSTPHLWSAGKDTVYDHEVFNSSRSVQEIKKIIREEYFFTNPSESIVFIGFDGNYPKQKPVKIETPKDTVQKEKLRIDEDPEQEERRRSGKGNSWFTILIMAILSVLTRGTF